jgi:hypothetical protein
LFLSGHRLALRLFFALRTNALNAGCRVPGNGGYRMTSVVLSDNGASHSAGFLFIPVARLADRQLALHQALHESVAVRTLQSE